MINCNTRKAYWLMHEATKALADVEYTGIRIDTDYLNKAIEETKITIAGNTFHFFKNTELGQEWKRVWRNQRSISNNDQLRHVLFEEMEVKSKMQTDKGEASVDEKALQKLNVDGITELIEIRKLEKGVGTYLKGILRETTNGILHPMYSLNIPKSYRSSSQHPNFQNMPIRNELLGKLIRNCFIPRDDCIFGEADFKGLEVHISACYNHDPVLIEYLTDPTKDMHRDMAAECFLLPEDNISKMTRYTAKNGFVFPQFYGSYFEDCAISIWDMIGEFGLMADKGVDMKEHLRHNGIKNLSAFTKHIKKVEDGFWNDRFTVYTQWKQDFYNEYLQKGYFMGKTGFIYQGIFRRNQVINFPVQGAAFHCLLWSLIHINKEFRKKKMKSRIIGQIHDSMVLNIYPNEMEDVLKIIWRVSCIDICKAWDWITVPLAIEFEMCPVNMSWFNKKEKEYSYEG